MGTNIFVLKSTVGIKKNQFDNVLASVQGLQGKETTGYSEFFHFPWLPCCDLNDVQTVEEMFELWRWPIEFDEQGNIVELCFQGEKIGAEDLFFAAIGPYVSSGSEIVVLSEDYQVWRWLFERGTCKKQYGRFVFDE